jgi:UDP-N-acetylmuramate--alanine ligase
MSTPAPLMGRLKHLHFVGIGGAGMRGLAEVFRHLGFVVSGSDVQDSPSLAPLRQLGIRIAIGHSPDNVAQADVLVRSSAIPWDNAEILAAQARHIPIVSRAQMLGELMRFRRGIAVAGTHGKTTTTSLIATLLVDAGLDPTLVIGGQLNKINSHAYLGQGHYLVAEADESDASFLHLQPVLAVVTNIDADHLENYEYNFQRLRQAFVQFLHNLPFYGVAVVCLDDLYVREMLPEVQRLLLTYGLTETAQIRATEVTHSGRQSRFMLHLPDQEPLPILLNLPGLHNVRNALAAIAIGFELGIAPSVMQKSLAGFSGVGRRLQSYGERQTPIGSVLLVDDYGHHPNELQASMSALRAGFPNRPLVVVFQPHRYSRTHALFSDFVHVLQDADVLFLLDIYAAGETPLPNVSSALLLEKIQERRPNLGELSTLADLPVLLEARLLPENIVLLLGAGSIGQMAKVLAARWPLLKD